MQNSTESNQYKSHAKALNFYYGAFHALKNIDMALHDKKITALIDRPVVVNRHFYVALIECMIFILVIDMKVKLFCIRIM